MLVLKFGGTSVGDTGCILRVAGIIKSSLPRRPVVVLSAMSRVTDSLLAGTEAAARGDTKTTQSIVCQIRERHLSTAAECVHQPYLADLERDINRWADELDQIYSALCLLREASTRSIDRVAAYGERLSCALVCATLCSDGIPSRSLKAEDIVKTDGNFGEAMPLIGPTAQAARETLCPLLDQGIVPVVPGFAGATSDGLTTTLGRGGSDYTATTLGAALDADEVLIYSDTNGVMTADPKVVCGASSVSHLSYAEARELAFFGAKVIHPRTVLPAVDHNFPIRVLNSFNPGFEGTIITAEGERSGQSVKSIAYSRAVSVVTVEGSGRPGGPRVAARALSTLESLAIDALLTNASSPEQNLSFILPASRAESVLRELRVEFADEIRRGEIRGIDLHNGYGVFACVGESLGDTSGVGARVFGTLGRINVSVHGFAQAPSGTSFAFVVDAESLDEAVRELHREFISTNGDAS